ncbi:MAG: carbohydrate ABC transporter permease [Tyzzerella sp.]|nr:carbohydrate ABC transporter permease [Tyzzerella sp.]
MKKIKLPKRHKRLRVKRSQWPAYICLTPMVLLSLLPILYIVFTAFKPIGELFAYPPKFITLRPTFDNFRKLFEASENTVFPLSMYLFNSIVSTVLVVFLGMAIAVATAYVLSKKRFRGREIIFKLNTLSMMFVATAVSIPRYLIVKEVGLLDSFWANVVPMLALPVGVFLLKQFVDQLPDALIESARIDGANDYQIIWKIVLPLVKPAMATVAILLFQHSWNGMEASNLFINTESLKTFAFYMNSLSNSGNGVAGVGMSAAASLLMFVPNVVLFVMMQSRVMSTMAHSGLK